MDVTEMKVGMKVRGGGHSHTLTVARVDRGQEHFWSVEQGDQQWNLPEDHSRTPGWYEPVQPEAGLSQSENEETPAPFKVGDRVRVVKPKTGMTVRRDLEAGAVEEIGFLNVLYWGRPEDGGAAWDLSRIEPLQVSPPLSPSEVEQHLAHAASLVKPTRTPLSCSKVVAKRQQALNLEFGKGVFELRERSLLVDARYQEAKDKACFSTGATFEDALSSLRELLHEH